MNIAVIGTGAVGQAISKKLAELGHKVFMGTRDVDQSLKRTDTDSWGTPGIGSWIKENPKVELTPFKKAVEKGQDLLVFAIHGMAAMEALNSIGEELLNGRVMIDISNPLDFSKGFPPTLSICNTESLGEQIQNTYPQLKVVKALNTVSNSVMINPKSIKGDHVVFICGNDAGAKQKVSSILESFGWKSGNIIGLGDITSARGTEMTLPLWTRLMGKYQSPLFNFNIVKAAAPSI